MREGNLFISFFGPSCAGKTTSYKYAADFLMDRGFEVLRMDVAYPLRCIQSYAYELFGMDHPGDPAEPETFKQDGALLGFLARHFESSFEHSIRHFLASIGMQSGKLCVVNTDCRSNAYEALRGNGFVFIRVKARSDIIAGRKLMRGDLTPFKNLNVEAVDAIEASYEIDNNGTLDDLNEQIVRVLSEIIYVSN